MERSEEECRQALEKVNEHVDHIGTVLHPLLHLPGSALAAFLGGLNNEDRARTHLLVAYALASLQARKRPSPSPASSCLSSFPVRLKLFTKHYDDPDYPIHHDLVRLGEGLQAV